MCGLWSFCFMFLLNHQLECITSHGNLQVSPLWLWASAAYTEGLVLRECQYSSFPWIKSITNFSGFRNKGGKNCKGRNLMLKKKQI